MASFVSHAHIWRRLKWERSVQISCDPRCTHTLLPMFAVLIRSLSPWRLELIKCTPTCRNTMARCEDRLLMVVHVDLFLHNRIRWRRQASQFFHAWITAHKFADPSAVVGFENQCVLHVGIDAKPRQKGHRFSAR